MATTDRHFGLSFPRGTLLVLVMSGLLYAVHWFVYYAIELSFNDTQNYTGLYIHYAFFVLLPLTGWAADSWLGRYRSILVGLILSAVTTVLFQITFVMLQLEWTPVQGVILSTVGMSLGLLGFGSFYTNMLPFTLDQSIEALAEQFSAVVQWYY